MLLQTVAEAKPWRDQQVLGFFFLPAAEELALLWVCAAGTAGVGEPLPSLPIPRTSAVSRC